MKDLQKKLQNQDQLVTEIKEEKIKNLQKSV